MCTVSQNKEQVWGWGYGCVLALRTPTDAEIKKTFACLLSHIFAAETPYFRFAIVVIQRDSVFLVCSDQILTPKKSMVPSCYRCCDIRVTGQKCTEGPSEMDNVIFVAAHKCFFGV